MNLAMFFVQVFLATCTFANASYHPSFSTHTLSRHIGGLWNRDEPTDRPATTTTGESGGTKISFTSPTSHTSAIDLPVPTCFAGGDELALSKRIRDDNAIRFCGIQRDVTLTKDFPGISATYYLNGTYFTQPFQVTWVPRCKAANMAITGDGTCNSILRTLGDCKLIAHLLIFSADYLERRQIRGLRGF